MRRNKNMDFLFRQHRSNRRYSILRGGTRSGKTYAALQFIFLNALAGNFKLCSIVAPTVPHLKRGALRDWLHITGGFINKYITYKQTDNIFKFKNGAMVEFFSSDSPERLRGAGRDWLFVNEANTHDEEAFDELDQRTLQKVIIDFNPVCRFWLNDKLEKLNISIKQNEVVTTYKDNPHLPKAFVRALERRKSLPDWWRVFGEGEYGEARGRVIYNFDIIHNNITPEVIGIDFGEGRSPSAIVAVARYGGGVAVQEIYYGMGGIRTLAEMLAPYRNLRIVGDNAQLDVINMLRREGIPVVPCRKMSLVASFHLVNNIELSVSNNSENLIKEIQSLEWSDRGLGLIKAGAADHAVDAMRYAIHEII